MKEYNLIIQKIPKCYVGEDCVQVMIPFTNSIRIFENDTGIVQNIKCIYFLNDNYNAINTYISDERRNKFPYSNIPLHCSFDRMRKVYYVNQLFDFDVDYWSIVDENVWYTDSNVYSNCAGYLVHNYLVKDNDEVLLVSQYYNITVYNKYNAIQGDLPGKKYTLEEIKGLSLARIQKIRNNPRLSLILNPNIHKEDIKKARRMVRTLNNK